MQCRQTNLKPGLRNLISLKRREKTPKNAKSLRRTVFDAGFARGTPLLFLKQRVVFIPASQQIGQQIVDFVLVQLFQ